MANRAALCLKAPGEIPESTYDPDLAILLAQLRKNSINLLGPKATEVIEPANDRYSKSN